MDSTLNATIKDLIKDNLQELPFIARYWDIYISDTGTNDPNEKIRLGKYNAVMKNAYPFYKSISKIIDITHISE